MLHHKVELSRKELRRLKEIVAGDRTAKNTPEEDALFRKKLIKEQLTAFVYEDDATSADQRAVVPEAEAEIFLEQYVNEQKKNRQDTFRFWLTTIIAVASLLVSIISGMP